MGYIIMLLFRKKNMLFSNLEMFNFCHMFRYYCSKVFICGYFYSKINLISMNKL